MKASVFAMEYTVDNALSSILLSKLLHSYFVLTQMLIKNFYLLFAWFNALNKITLHLNKNLSHTIVSNFYNVERKLLWILPSNSLKINFTVSTLYAEHLLHALDGLIYNDRIQFFLAMGNDSV